MNEFTIYTDENSRVQYLKGYTDENGDVNYRGKRKTIKECSESELKLVNTIAYHPKYIILDKDFKDITPTEKQIEKSWKETVEKLEEHNIQNYIIDRSPNGYHVFIETSNLENLDKDVQTEIRKQFILVFDCDISKASADSNISIPNRPHFRTKINYGIIKEVKGPLFIIKDKLIEKVKEKINELLQKTQKNNNDIDFKDYFETDPLWKYVCNNKIKEGTNRDIILFKNIEIASRKTGKSKEEIKEIVEPIIIKNFPGKNYGEFKGWSNSKFTDYNHTELNIWMKTFAGYKKDIYPEEIEPLNIQIEKIQNTKENKITEEDIRELREQILLKLATKKRTEATELLTQSILAHNYLYTSRDDNKSEMWYYKDGIYVPSGRTYIKEFCVEVLKEAYSTNIVNEVIYKLEAHTYVDPDEFFRNNYIDEIIIENGILNIKTRELNPFTPKKIFFNKLPIKYNPNATCPNITKHFETVLKDKEDSKILFEIFGYLLLKENKFEKAFIFLGDGSNGKSKTLDLMKRFIGIDNCSSLPLKSMESKDFQISELFSKMANLAADLDYNDLKDIGMVKQLIGRDTIQAKRKYLNTLKFVNYSKLLFATNTLPRVYDISKGFFRRWILLDFPFEFVEESRYNTLTEELKKYSKIMDTEIIDKLSTPSEISGLLNKSLDSLDRLLKNKKFSKSMGINETKAKWMGISDSVWAFCQEYIEEDATYNNRLLKSEFKLEYLKFYKKHKLRDRSDKHIKDLLTKEYQVDEVWVESNVAAWRGIKFKEGVLDQNSKEEKK